MSIAVDLDALAGELAQRTWCYLATAPEGDGAPHLVAVTPRLEGDPPRLVVEAAGRTTRANVAAHPAVALVWPPGEPGGYSLVVDGTAEVRDDTVAVTPQRAVLHRPAPPAADAGACGSDCIEL